MANVILHFTREESKILEDLAMDLDMEGDKPADKVRSMLTTIIREEILDADEGQDKAV